MSCATVLRCRIKAKRKSLFCRIASAIWRSAITPSSLAIKSTVLLCGALSSLRPNLTANLLMRTVMFLSVPGSLCSQKLPGANLGRTYSQACLFSQHTLSFPLPLQIFFLIFQISDNVNVGPQFFFYLM